MTEFYSTQKEIDAWLQAAGVKNYTINADMSVDVEGGVNLSKKNLTHIPVNFRHVSGSFLCEENQLVSLKGSPQSVGRVFNCSNNLLTSLLYGPKTVGASYICERNQLTSLQYIATTINHVRQMGFYHNPSINCSYNQLSNLEHSPQHTSSSFWCAYNRLETLEGCPGSVGGAFNVSNNQLSSLEHCPQRVDGSFFCYKNPMLGSAQEMMNFNEIQAFCLEIAKIKDEKKRLDSHILEVNTDAKNTPFASIHKI